ncbi:MAG TPA: copper resistance CopC family protein [Methylocella sp.]|nr:copper resistance CopC family protein [Methylocella sp.]
MGRVADRRVFLSSFLGWIGATSAISRVEAHSRLVKSEPAARSVVDAAPKELKLWFNENVEPAFARVWIVPTAGADIQLSSRGDSSDPRLLVATLPDDLPAGPVNIGYHVLSVDGHVVDDKLSFTINKTT